MHAPAPIDPEIRSARRAAVGALFAAAVALHGCGGGSDEAASPAPPTSPSPPPSAPSPPPSSSSTGRFIDSAVGNLGYACTGGGSPNNGITDSLGNFNYGQGQTCTFTVGGITLGSATAGPLLTPINLVPGAQPGVANTTVTNIARFLMSIDSDGNPDNGIAIADAVKTALAGSTLDFAAGNFDTAAAALVNTAINGRALVDATTANAHLDLSLTNLFAGAYNCTYSAVVSGVDTVLGTVAITINDGTITGAGTPAGSNSTFDVDGAINPSGAANLSTGGTSTGASFVGTFSTDGTAANTSGSGTWDDPEAGSGTWSCHHTTP
ncbi:MAG TPA: hypothetical protein VML58_23010 [Burkholderiaceae bacterium]|nr:hypothetical protein [Burkholderiaceae bacterium]